MEHSVSKLRPEELVPYLPKEGTIFFDSAGNSPCNASQPISIIATAPLQTLQGHLSSSLELEEVLEEYRSSCLLASYPVGGLAGWIDYDGNYTFGVYEKFWVYCHTKQNWLQEGKLPSAGIRSLGVTRSITPVWTSHTPASEYLKMVQQAKKSITKGDLYQINLAQKFSTTLPTELDLYPLYLALRRHSPAPMAAYGVLEGRELLCSSPETFLKIRGNIIKTSPIKGTSARHSDPELDRVSAQNLKSSEKENAELLMITDLLRNDLGQICSYGSVQVDTLCRLEQLEQVYHLISTVKGTLSPKWNHLSAIKACLPGGSITGAPKRNAQHYIQKLESQPRGLYTGNVGYISFNNLSQFNIIIRSMIREDKKLHYHVGAGIVADSDPIKEYQETILKAKGIEKALESVFRSQTYNFT